MTDKTLVLELQKFVDALPRSLGVPRKIAIDWGNDNDTCELTVLFARLQDGEKDGIEEQAQ